MDAGPATKAEDFGEDGTMGLTLAERSRLITPSATLAMAAEARKLKADGVAVLDFALGEPDFPTQSPIQSAMGAGDDVFVSKLNADIGMEVAV